MASPRRELYLAIAACTLFACGTRPDAPGSAEGSGASGLVSGAQSEDDDDDDDDGVDSVASPSLPAPSADPPDAGAPPAEEPPPEDVGDPESPEQSLEACTTQRGECSSLQVAVSDPERAVCIQLTIDNCGGYTRAGLPVDLPVAWRLGSASLADLREGCVPGAFDATNVIIVDADGSISWNEETPVPTEVLIDVTLVPSQLALDNAPITIAAGALADPLLECEE